jgi:uncharacterized protein (DUF305 family)
LLPVAAALAAIVLACSSGSNNTKARTDSAAAAADTTRADSASTEGIATMAGMTGNPDSAFRQAIITHHREGIRMIDEFLPKLTRADLKSMAEQMRAAQMKEVGELERKAQRR